MDTAHARDACVVLLSHGVSCISHCELKKLYKAPATAVPGPVRLSEGGSGDLKRRAAPKNTKIRSKFRTFLRAPPLL